MPIHLECHGCGQKMRLKDEAAGGKVRCPACQYVMDIPGGEEEERLRRRRRRRRRPLSPMAQAVGMQFDAMAHEEDPLLVRAMDSLFCINVVLLLLAAAALMPFAVFDLLFGNDREAWRNALLVLFFGMFQIMLAGFLLLLFTNLGSLY
jgi:hypothetical protein